MKSSELTQEIARRTDLPKAHVAMVLDCLADVIQESLTRGDGEVHVKGLGKFVAQYREAREARNPRTGETIHVPAKVATQFRATKHLRTLPVRT